MLCTAVAAPAPVYANGIAEPLADILLTCEREGPALASPPSEVSLSVSVSLNASVTNAIGLDSGTDVSDAVLVVNGNDCPAPHPRGSTFGSCGAPSAIVQDPQFGRLTSVGTLEWSNVAIPYPGAIPAGDPGSLEGGVSTLRIRGIRANAAQLRLAGSASQTSLPVIATVRVRSNSVIAVRNGTVRLAYPTPALGVAVVGEESSSACSGDGRGLASIQIREGFASAFRSGIAGAGTSAATRVMLEFDDVPEGVGISLPVAVGCHQPRFDGGDSETQDALTLGLVSGHDANGSGGTASLGPVGSEPSVPVDVSSGGGRAVYEVQSQDPARLEDCHIPVSLDAGSDGATQARANISAGLAPRSTLLVASAEAPRPRFATPPRTAQAGIDFAACSTTLLFPFVTNQAGFTTGLVITHGSRPALTGSLGGQPGSCDLHYYGAKSEGEEILLVQHSTVIEPGEQLIFTLSGGNPARNILGTEQFQGYMMAVCGYPNARGYAFIADGFGDIADLAMGYLAPVVPLGPDGKRLVLDEGPQ